MPDNDEGLGWALPAFQPETALAGLKRELRALGLNERAGTFERRGGVAIARAAVQGQIIEAARVKRPVRSSPEWLRKSLSNGADVRHFLADLKTCLAQWSDHDD